MGSSGGRARAARRSSRPSARRRTAAAPVTAAGRRGAPSSRRARSARAPPIGRRRADIPSLLLLEPGVPEVREWNRAGVAPQLLAYPRQEEHIAELDPPHVLVEEGLDAVNDGFPLPQIRLPGQLAEEPILLLEAPPADP